VLKIVLFVARVIVTDTIAISVDNESSTMSVFVAKPAAPGRHPSCIVCPEIFGLTHHVREATERLASAGYVAVVPDFHHRTEPGAVLGYDEAGRQKGLALLRQLHRPQVLEDLAATIRYLRARQDTTYKIAVLGFSAGGHIAYLAASAYDVSAVVSLYGGWITNMEIPLSRPEPTITLTPSIGRHGAHVLFIVGNEDHLIGKEQRDAIEGALRGAQVRHELVVYEGAKHGFFFDGRATFDPIAADDTRCRAGENGRRLRLKIVRPSLEFCASSDWLASDPGL
jgi:carboxymethylenebutenolidase